MGSSSSIEFEVFGSMRAKVMARNRAPAAGRQKRVKGKEEGARRGFGLTVGMRGEGRQGESRSDAIADITAEPWTGNGERRGGGSDKHGPF